MPKKPKSQPVPYESLTPAEKDFIRLTLAIGETGCGLAHVVLARARSKSRFVQKPGGRSSKAIRLDNPLGEREVATLTKVDAASLARRGELASHRRTQPTGPSDRLRHQPSGTRSGHGDFAFGLLVCSERIRIVGRPRGDDRCVRLTSSGPSDLRGRTKVWTSIILTPLALGAVHDFVRQYEAYPKTVLLRYDRLRWPSGTGPIEIPIAGAPRLLAALTADDVTLLAVGGHETVPRYREAMLVADRRRPHLRLRVSGPTTSQSSGSSDGAKGTGPTSTTTKKCHPNGCTTSRASSEGSSRPSRRRWREPTSTSHVDSSWSVVLETGRRACS